MRCPKRLKSSDLINLTLALGSIWLTLRMRQWHNQLIDIRTILIAWEYRLSQMLPQTAQQLTLNQVELNGLHQKYSQLKIYRRQFQQVLAVIQLGQKLMLRVDFNKRRHKHRRHHRRGNSHGR